MNIKFLLNLNYCYKTYVKEIANLKPKTGFNNYIYFDFVSSREKFKLLNLNILLLYFFVFNSNLTKDLLIHLVVIL